MFSTRFGYKEEKAIQFESMDGALKTRLWNAVYSRLYRSEFPELPYWRINLLRTLLSDHFKQPANNFAKDTNGLLDQIKKRLDIQNWCEVYDFIEVLLKKADECEIEDLGGLAEEMNKILEEEKAGYRIINDLVTPITNNNEIGEVKEALAKTDKYAPASEHIKNALALYSDRKNPNYKKATEEAVLALEAALRIGTNNPKNTMGKILELPSVKEKFHGTIISLLGDLYGYSSDAPGIRHSNKSKEINDSTKNSVEEKEARMVLIVCSALFNYILSSFL